MPENDTPAYGGLGALAAALAKAQAAFPPITRDKEVTVMSKRTNSTYKFKYAPLDTIIEKTRKPLADNGLAVAQLLDSDADGAPALVTMLLHADGGTLTARTPIPQTDGGTVQDFGSAITYLRRYAIQALLGVAAEEDDDGNSASGNQATFSERNHRAAAPENQPQDTNGGLIGTAEKGTARTSDYSMRQSPDGPFLGFRLKDGRSRGGQLIEAWGPLAEALVAIESMVIGQRVQVWGHFQTRNLSKGGSYQAFVIERIAGPEFSLPGEPSEPDSLPLFDAAEEAELDAAVEAPAAA